MKVEGIRTLAGPNVYTHRPALVMRLDLEDLAGRETREVEGFNERLLAALPGLAEHHCSPGRAGGFVERLGEGTYFGHAVEHAALELTGLAGVGVTHGKTRVEREPNLYNVVVEYRAEHATRHLLESAVALVGALVRGETFDVAAAVEEARRIVARTELGPSTRAIVEAAARRRIPWERVGTGSIVRFGWGKHRRFDKLEPLRRILLDFGAEPVETIEGLAAQAGAAAASAPQAAAAQANAESPQPSAGVRRAGRARANPAPDRQGYIWG